MTNTGKQTIAYNKGKIGFLHWRMVILRYVLNHDLLLSFLWFL